MRKISNACPHCQSPHWKKNNPLDPKWEWQIQWKCLSAVRQAKRQSGREKLYKHTHTKRGDDGRMEERRVSKGRRSWRGEEETKRGKLEREGKEMTLSLQNAYTYTFTHKHNAFILQTCCSFPSSVSLSLNFCLLKARFPPHCYQVLEWSFFCKLIIN